MWGRFQELRVVHGQQIIDREVALVRAERELQYRNASPVDQFAEFEPVLLALVAQHAEATDHAVLLF